MSYKMLFSPMKIGGVEIKNRIVMPPMLMGFANFDGTATDTLLDYYEERAKGGTGLIMTEITRINDKTGSSAFAQLGVSHDYQIKSIAKLAERVHKHGAKLFVQLHHPGRQNIGLMVGTVPLCIGMHRMLGKGFDKTLFKVVPKVGPKLMAKNLVPSSVCPSACEPSFFSGGRVRALRRGEIKKLITQFVDGAERAQKAGADGVEIHAAHGYLIQQFLSPNTNHRTDEYGGSLENRMRFLTEIIEGIRARLGKSFPIIVRLSVDECYDKIGQSGKGYALSEGVKMAKLLEAAGIDAIDVSSAAYDTFNYWLEPTSFEVGWRKYMAAAVKAEVKIPVLAANLIRSPQQAEQQLEDGAQDFVSLGRPHIADPYWASKAESGRENEIKRCICCLYCFESMQNNAYHGSHGCCSVNPLVGQEKLFDSVKRDGDGRVVAIVGAGVAGLTAAEILGKRGFKPIVLERSGEIGGQLQLANKPPKKDKISWAFEDLAVNAKLQGAEIRLNTEATAEYLKQLNPYAIFVATGGFAVKPRSIEGVDLPMVCTVTEILNGTVKLKNKTVAVIGSGMTGLETSELLAESGNKITIIEMADSIAPGTWMQHTLDALPNLEAVGTKFLTSTKLLKITAKGVVVENTKTKEQQLFTADNVILSLGVRPENKLVEQLKGFDNVVVIGDANKIGRIANATKSAFDAAIQLK